MSASSSFNEVVAPVPREAPGYQATDFQPQQPESFVEALAMIGSRRAAVGSALVALDSCDLPTWTGAAADNYRFYLRGLRQVLGNVDKLLEGCLDPITSAQDECDGLLQQAAGIATDANAAQKKYATAKAKGDAAVAVLAWAELSLVVSAGTAVQRRTQAVLAELAATLNSADTALSELVFPQPPDDGANGTVFSPIRQLRELEGDTAEARDLLARINGGSSPIGDHATREELMNLSPSEREYVLEHLDQEETRQLLAGLAPDELDDLLLTSDPNLIRYLGAADDSGAIIPEQPPGHHHDWIETDFSSHPNADPTQLHQGGLGDCHYLAALASLEETNPGFLNSHITPNETNGTYTVTLYDPNGSEVEVTVDGRIPGEGTQSSYAASDGTRINAYQIYEKAIAAAHERGLISLPAGSGQGYSTINGGWAADDWQAVTGHVGTQHSPASITAQDINQQLHGQPPQPVVVCSRFGDPPTVPPGYERWYDPDYGTVDANGNPRLDANGNPVVATHPYLVPGHEYYVIAATDTTITLANPWGQDDARNGQVTLTTDEYRALTERVSTGGLR